MPDIYVFRRPSAPSVALDAPRSRRDRGAMEPAEGIFRAPGSEAQSGEFLAAFQEFCDDGRIRWQGRGVPAPMAGAARLSARRARSGTVRCSARLSRASRRSTRAARAVFFGRDLVVAQAIERLRRAGEPDPEGKRAPFLLLIGASGSGKSSLLRAGLLPRLVLPGAIPEVDLWRRAIDDARPRSLPVAGGKSVRRGRARRRAARGARSAPRRCSPSQLAGDPDIAIAPLRDALDAAAASAQARGAVSTRRVRRGSCWRSTRPSGCFSRPTPGLRARFAALVVARWRGRASPMS